MARPHRIGVVLAGLLLVAAASARAAESPADRDRLFESAKRDTLGGGGPRAVWMTTTWNGPSTVTTIFLRPNRGGAPSYVVKRRLPDAGVVWASDSTCAGLAEAMRASGRIVVRPRLAIEEGWPSSYTTDGVLSRLWTRAVDSFNGGGLAMELSSNDGDLAAWAAATEQALASCWTPQAP